MLSLSPAFRHLPSRHLQEMTIALAFVEFLQPNLDSWTELSLLLEDPRNYPALRSLTFIGLEGDRYVDPGR
jgi:hypothetical protein